MQVFQKEITVQQNDLDELNHVNNIQYLRWIQDIAREHWQENANQHLIENYFWVVLSHNIEYKASALINDTLLLNTYVSESKGVTSTRIVDVLNAKSNKVLATCETRWCLMGKSSKKPSRITEEIIELFN